MAFTSHNIRLADGSYTMPGMDSVLEDYEWLISAKRYVNMVFGNDASRKSVIDLGCLEGGYTVAFARMGMRSLGLEVRASNFENCEYVKKNVEELPVDFVKDDAWNADKYGNFDLVFCSGLLYHLDKPGQFIDLIGKIAQKMVIIHTHYAPEEDSSVFTLSPITEHDGYRGRWYHEHESDKIEEIETYRWSSWTNKNSFWMSKGEILKSLQKNGFDIVFEAFDFLRGDIAESMRDGYYATESRGMFIGVRS